MTEYINKVELLRGTICKGILCSECSFNDDVKGARCKLIRYINELPAIQIVHCKECKYGNHIDDSERLKCFHWLHRIDENYHEPDWFCADGERKD